MGTKTNSDWLAGAPGGDIVAAVRGEVVEHHVWPLASRRGLVSFLAQRLIYPTSPQVPSYIPFTTQPHIVMTLSHKLPSSCYCTPAPTPAQLRSHPYRYRRSAERQYFV